MNVAEQLHESMKVPDALFMKNVSGGDWDELTNGFEANIRTQIAECARMADAAFKAVVSAGTMNAEFNSLATGALRDLKIYADQLNALVMRRNGRSGRTRSSAEYTEYMAIGLELSELSENMRLVIGDVMFNLNDHYGNALAVIREREAAEKEQQTATAEQAGEEALPVDEQAAPVETKAAE